MPLLEFAELLTGPYLAIVSRLYLHWCSSGVLEFSDYPVLYYLLSIIIVLPVGLAVTLLFYRFISIVGDTRKSKNTVFVHQDNVLNESIKENIRMQAGEYNPPWWYSAHMGTLVAFSGDCKLAYHREVIHTHDDGGHYCLSWYPRKPSADSSCKIIIYAPGLGLSATSVAVQKYCLEVASDGYVVAVVGARGVDSPLTSSRLWHPGRYEDVLHTVHYAHQLSPSSTLRLCGYSAGSNLCLQTLLHLHARHQLHLVQSCCVVCMCFDYLHARHRMENSSVGLVYSTLMCLMLKDIVRKNLQVFAHEQEQLEARLSRCILLSHYDAVMAKDMHGFVEPGDLQRCTSLAAFKMLPLPVLAIQPEDDPLHMGSARENVQVDELVRDNPGFVYMEPPRGNHFGFYEGPLLQAFDTRTTSYTYPAKAAAAFFRTVEAFAAAGKR